MRLLRKYTFFSKRIDVGSAVAWSAGSGFCGFKSQSKLTFQCSFCLEFPTHKLLEAVIRHQIPLSVLVTCDSNHSCESLLRCRSAPAERFEKYSASISAFPPINIPVREFRPHFRFNFEAERLSKFSKCRGPPNSRQSTRLRTPWRRRVSPRTNRRRARRGATTNQRRAPRLRWRTRATATTRPARRLFKAARERSSDEARSQGEIFKAARERSSVEARSRTTRLRIPRPPSLLT